jgi:hypothetical protein
MTAVAPPRRVLVELELLPAIAALRACIRERLDCERRLAALSGTTGAVLARARESVLRELREVSAAEGALRYALGVPVEAAS